MENRIPQYMYDALSRYDFKPFSLPNPKSFLIGGSGVANKHEPIYFYLRELGFNPPYIDAAIIIYNISDSIWGIEIKGIYDSPIKLFRGNILNEEFLTNLLKSIFGDPYIESPLCKESNIMIKIKRNKTYLGKINVGKKYTGSFDSEYIKARDNFKKINNEEFKFVALSNGIDDKNRKEWAMWSHEMEFKMYILTGMMRSSISSKDIKIISEITYGPEEKS
jgi:hypothetical protein